MKKTLNTKDVSCSHCGDEIPRGDNCYILEDSPLEYVICDKCETDAEFTPPSV